MSLEECATVSVNMILFRSKIWITDPRQKFKSFYSCYRMLKWTEVFQQTIEIAGQLFVLDASAS